jgi:hypothetical protein
LNNAHSAETSGDWANANGMLTSELNANMATIPDKRCEEDLRKNWSLADFHLPKRWSSDI